MNLDQILDQINELINRGIAGIALFIIAFLLALHFFGKDAEKNRKKH